ncbi:hypothetical protein [Corynebacterium aquatimens]|uniref:hypothetical protein n=1 Tax=Corynebacterium aquatimens TaxID=1190508 RepID=UPI0033130E44
MDWLGGRTGNGRFVTVDQILSKVWNQSFGVVGVSAHGHRSPLKRPFITAARRTDSVDYVVVDVAVETAGGIFRAQGSAAETVKVTGESAQTILREVNGPIRSELERFRGTLEEMYQLLERVAPNATSARAAVDVAVHSAVATAHGLPLGVLLSGYPPYSFPSGSLDGELTNDMTVSLDAPEIMAQRAAEAVRDGYSILKIKLGSDPEADRVRLQSVMDATPESLFDLMRTKVGQPSRLYA